MDYAGACKYCKSFSRLANHGSKLSLEFLQDTFLGSMNMAVPEVDAMAARDDCLIHSPSTWPSQSSCVFVD